MYNQIALVGGGEEREFNVLELMSYKSLYMIN